MPLSRQHSRSARSAYTLVEVLIVMGIIVLAITLAIPAIRSLTGSRSEQAAQNTVSAFLARCRTEAIGLQQVEGALFYIDPATDRVTLVQVQQSPTQPADLGAGIIYLDLVPDRDTLALPPGIRAWTIKETVVATGYVDPFPNYRYLGYNAVYPNGATTMTATDKATLGGVILYDGYGRLKVTRYGFRFQITTPAAPSNLANFCYMTPSTSDTDWAPATSASSKTMLTSQIGFVVFGREAFLNNQGFTDANVTTAATVKAVDNWLDANTSPILVNRYNGTLTRAE
jgi:type II secretory pathway pseudopilin PulG